MHRRDFIAATMGAIAGGAVVSGVPGTTSLVAVAGSPHLDAATFHASQRFATTLYGRASRMSNAVAARRRCLCMAIH